MTAIGMIYLIQFSVFFLGFLLKCLSYEDEERTKKLTMARYQFWGIFLLNFIPVVGFIFSMLLIFAIIGGYITKDVYFICRFRIKSDKVLNFIEKTKVFLNKEV